MKAKFIYEVLNEAFERKNKEETKRQLLFPEMDKIKDSDSLKDFIRENDISLEDIPDYIKERILKSYTHSRWPKHISTWRFRDEKYSEWVLIKELFNREQIAKILDKINQENAWGLGLEDKDKGILIDILRKQKSIKRDQIKDIIREFGDIIREFGLKELLEITDKSKVKLSNNNLITIGLCTGLKDYTIKGLKKGGRGIASELRQIKNLLGEKEYEKYFLRELTPEQMFTRGLLIYDTEMMLKAVKNGAKNIHQGSELAFSVAALSGDLKLLDAIMKSPGFDPTLNHKSGIDNNQDERHFAIRRAAKKGLTDVVKRLLKDPRVDPAYKNNFALKWAIIGGFDDTIKVLLKDKRVSSTLYKLPKKQFKFLQEKNYIKNES